MLKYFLLNLTYSIFFVSNSFGFDIGVDNSSVTNSSNCQGALSGLTAEVKNFGTVQVDSFYVYIDINGVVFDTLFIVQNLIIGQQVSIALGNYNLTDSLNNTIALSTDLPNGNSDLNTNNDTYIFNTYMRLSGVYSVGCATCDFSTLIGAANHLDDYGVCGPTTFNIVDGTYSSGQFNLGPFNGMSASNPVIFQSITQDSTAVSFAPFVSPSIVLNSVQYVTFRKLTVDPQAGGIGFKLTSVSNFNIENCRILSAQVQTGYSGGGPSFDSVKIINNNFISSSIVFNNNGANPSNSNGIVEIKNNSFINSYVRFSQFAHVNLEENFINSPNINYPIELIACQEANISKNSMTQANEGLLIRNFCSIINVTNNFFRGDGQVLEVSNSNNINIVNNNFHQYDGSNDMGTAALFHLSTGVEFINNILHSDEYGSLIYCSDTSILNPHHNIYFSPSDSLVQFGSNHFTFQEWTVNYGKDSNSWNYNPHYLSPADLHIYNLVIADGNAHPFSGIIDDFDGDSRNLSAFDIGADEINLDYSTLRDIGLISMIEPHVDSCSQADSIVLWVANYSVFQIDSFAVRRYLYGNFVDMVWNYTPLPAGDTVIVNVGEFNFSPNTTYKMELALDLPNGQPDNYELNNEADIFYQFLGSPNVSIREVSDCSLNYELTVPNQLYTSLLWSTGDATDKITVTSPGTWTVTLTNQSGCVVNKTITLN